MLSFLWTGIMLAFFQPSRKIPAVTDDSNRYLKDYNRLTTQLHHTNGNIIPSMCFVWIQFFDYRKYIIFLYFKTVYSFLCFVRKIKQCTRICNRRTLRGEKVIEEISFCSKVWNRIVIYYQRWNIGCFFAWEVVTYWPVCLWGCKKLSNFLVIFFWKFYFAVIIKSEDSIDLLISSSFNKLDHGTIIRTGITCKKIPL